jgi:hypothetical protein
MSELILEVESKEAGRNSKVRLFPDRIERTKPRSRLSVSGAAQDMEVTPVKAVSSVQAAKDGFSTKVTVFASGNTIEFRIFPHEAAHRFKDELMRLVLAGGVPAPAAAPVGGDRIARLKDIAELRDSGVLSDEEFAVEKARIMAEGETPAASAPESTPSSAGPSGGGAAGTAGRIAAGLATGGLSEAGRLLRRKK